MHVRSYLRILTLSLVVASPFCLLSGCGGGGADPAGSEEEADPTLDPTLNADEDTTMSEPEPG